MAKNQPHPSDPAKRQAAARAVEPTPAPASPPTPPAALRGQGLAGLGALRATLAGESERRTREAARAKQAARRSAADADLFRREIGEITPLAAPPRAESGRPPPEPVPKHTRQDEAAVLSETLSDEFDPETLLDTDETLYYHRPGVSRDVVRKLRSGAWIVQAQLDLHGMRRDEARDALAEFIRDAGKKGLRCLRVIHGKGLGSAGKEPVLKGKVRAWLVQKDEVIAFCQARGHDGGAGAVLVLLQPSPAPSGDRRPRAS
ncbi:Smr/MutS family protein [Burkholderia oklahomensis]|uniref:Smr domain protein n=2 Tax=Burkholderia oklahomensis TaxID=342113 RepID=A0AAI8FPM9_9BURK|nr:Smr/MutS family protein [Burkholderia oklahomensis]AIO67992.1 smr domain protein [Burkholderia oklahomensis]AOI41599.1 DNA mismatch repair protein MutS [Burkholderia oklahomensis EO147]KUY69196.1 DNA mismatch repair protein MutS [Burkholderia oklahomensis EO147]QPS36339.1 Smr/MutS family protein [Burkholderia oklahomensis]